MLEKIAKSIRENQKITEKREIDSIVKMVKNDSYFSSRVFTDIGEDSASLQFKDKLILMTTDRIKTDYIENFPHGAGFSAILVGVDDIYCCGGIPLATSLIISYKERSHLEKIIQGAIEGSNKFKVPIIRGHTSPNGKNYELSSTMIGEIKKEDYISARGAKVGDNIMLAIDMQGKIARANDLYWDTVTFKSSEDILFRRKAMNEIAHAHLVHSSKDVANGGIIGSIFQLCKYSEVGAEIEIEQIQIPPYLLDNEYDLETFLKMFLTTSYVLTMPEENIEDAVSLFNKHKIEAFTIGKIIGESYLKLKNGVKSINVLEI